ncbi:D-alanyl-D-alanine carboxypeptidase/D-alanyl-D-alanine-endopeptidase [Streptomyces sp. NPDC048172]|uniref:D-alanyl-D-alanine carboxypeptidase/D-alanyl-D-alanine endopeptidase n=1 Tax=Streptomyces sp. NPDC048172 TaxID=3365505 RepID=UPI00371AC9F1
MRILQRWQDTTPQKRQTVLLTAGSAALGLAVALTTVAATGPWDSGQRTAERAWAARQGDGSGTEHTGPGGGGPGSELTAPQVLAEAGPVRGRDGDGKRAGKGEGRHGGSGGARADQTPAPTVSALADTLEPLLKDGALGSVRTASVVDAVTGKELFATEPRTVATPASTVKIATAVAALSARGEDHRIPTRVVAEDDGGDSTVTLVGGGDPTLDEDGLDALAEKTARTLRKSDTEKVTLRYDLSRYEGTDQHPIGPNENLAPVVPLMLNEGRLDDSEHGPADRSGDPAGEAAEAFAKKLKDEDIEVEGAAEEKTAPKGAKRLATHDSAPLGDLVERMLTHSDNDIAEALARQTAIAEGEPASFEGAGKAVERRLDELGMPLKDARFADGSGLDREDRVSAALLTRLLAHASDPERTGLRPVLTGLPVAGFTGTLGGRYDSPREEPGAGLVRAKTGTLTGVNTLAGTVVDADGRMLAFAFMTTGAPDRDTAQESLDELASALANCGCRESPSGP